METNENNAFEAQGASETPAAAQGVTSRRGRPRKRAAEVLDDSKAAARRMYRRKFRAGKTRRNGVPANASDAENAENTAGSSASELRRAHLKQMKLNRQMGVERAVEKRRRARLQKVEEAPVEPAPTKRRRGRPPRPDKAERDASAAMARVIKQEERIAKRAAVVEAKLAQKAARAEARRAKKAAAEEAKLAKKAAREEKKRAKMTELLKAKLLKTLERDEKKRAKKAAQEEAKRVKQAEREEAWKRKHAAKQQPVVSFTYEGEPGKRVFIAGSFNDWNATANELTDVWGKGVYSCMLNIARGEYQYRLVVDGVWCNDPKNPAVIENGLGSYNNVIVVK